jgi:hypothetical protein
MPSINRGTFCGFIHDRKTIKQQAALRKCRVLLNHSIFGTGQIRRISSYNLIILWIIIFLSNAER